MISFVRSGASVPFSHDARISSWRSCQSLVPLAIAKISLTPFMKHAY